MNQMCDIFIMCFVLFLFVTCLGWNFNAIVVMGEEEEGGRAEEEEVSLGVIMTSTEIKFHILLFTLSSSSVSQSLSFNLLQSLYCPLSSVLALCLQIRYGLFQFFPFVKTQGHSSLLRMQCSFSIRHEVLPDVKPRLRDFDDDVDDFSQVISPVHGFSVFHPTDQIVHHLHSTVQYFPLW
jgi:hypothetical protein